MNGSHDSLRPSSGQGRSTTLHSGRQPRRGASRGRSCPGGRTEFTADAAVQPDEAPDPHAELDSLLSRVAAGDEHAFAQLYRLTAARLYGAIVRMIRDRHEAEDLLQDVFTTAWRRADSFDARRGTAMTWLMTLARNRTIDRIRQHRELPLDDELALSIPDENPTPDLGAQASQERLRLERGLAHLQAAGVCAAGSVSWRRVLCGAGRTHAGAARHDEELDSPQPDATQDVSRAMSA